jgi:hypothetical protein
MRNHIGCNAALCPNLKCRSTGECIDAVVARSHVKISERHYSPPLVPNQGSNGFGIVGEGAKDAAEYMPDTLWTEMQRDSNAERRLELAPKMRPPLKTAPVATRVLPTESAARKTYPMAAGLLDYFPDALAAVANVSYMGNEKHNPGEPLHHARGKSMDHADCIIRHLLNRGGLDGDVRESAAMAWRALALLQEELERDLSLPLPRGAR